MNMLGTIVLIFAAMVFAWFASVFFIRMGIKIEKHRAVKLYFAPQPQHPIPVEGFVQRMPGQEAGDVENPEQTPSFEETLHKHGRAVAYIRGRR